MGGVGITLQFTRDGAEDLDPLVGPIWAVLLEFMTGRQPRRAVAGPIFAHYVDDLAHDSVASGLFAAEGDAIRYMFHDPGGCCRRSVAATYHWTRLAIGASLAEIDRIAATRGARLDAPRIDLAEELARGPARGVFIQTRNGLYFAERSGPEIHIIGDDEDLTPTAGEARMVRAQLALGRCECPPCRFTRQALQRARRTAPHWTAELIVRWVCRTLGVDPDDLPASKRGKALAQARALVGFLTDELGPADGYELYRILPAGLTPAMRTNAMETIAALALEVPDDPPADLL